MAKQAVGSGGVDPLKRLEARLAKASRRSTYSAYLRDHFDAFTAIIGRFGARWAEIAKWAEEEGLTDGKPIKPDTAKRAYEREKHRRANPPERKRRKKAPEPPTPPSLPPSVRLAPQQAPETKPSPSGSDDVRRRGMEAQRWLHPSLNKKDREE